MKVRRKNLLYILITFFISLIFVIWGFISIFFTVPEYKIPLKKANITKTEIAFTLVGNKIPESKIKIYNSLVDKQLQIGHKKDTLLDAINAWLIFLIPSAMLTTFLYIPYYLISKKLRNKKEMKQNKLLQKRYMDKYHICGNEATTFCITGSITNQFLFNKCLLIQNDGNYIYLINRDFKNDIGIYKLNYNDITCFSRFGDFYTSMNISGGNSSFGNAALGYLLAGPAGAIIGSRTPIKGQTIVHDNRETIVFVKENNDEKYIFFEPMFYEYLMHIAPFKEISHLTKIVNTNEGDKISKLNKIIDLKNKGYINEEEFYKLKSELI